MDEKEAAGSGNERAVEPEVADEPEGPGSGAGDMDSPGKPETRLVQPCEKNEEPAKAYKTIHISSSSKARARIRTCDNCGYDNIPEARFCEGCGADLEEQERRNDFEKSMKQLEEYSEKAGKARARKDGKTILRKFKTPVMHPPVDIEKKSYQSHYIPPVTSGAGQFDPTAFEAGQAVGDPRISQQSAYPPQAHVFEGMRNYLAVPADYALQIKPRKRSTSFIVGVVLLSVLALILIGLIVTIIVLAL